MVVETKENLEPYTIELLQDLIQVNLDSFRMLAEGVDRVSDRTSATFLRSLSSERWEHVEELKRLVRACGELPDSRESLRSSAHRGWMKLRSTFSSDTAEAILAEVLRSERHLKDQYMDVLAQHPGTAVSDVLHRQFARVRAACQRASELCAGPKDSSAVPSVTDTQNV